jgi:hypothetical protein
MRQAILRAHSLPPSELLLCAIHTHSAPTLTLNPEKGHPNNVKYTEALQGKLVELVGMALDRMIPVAVGVGTGTSPVGANRREVTLDDAGKPKIVLGRNPSLLTDREVQVLKLTHADGGALSAAIFAYATHSTSLGPRNYLISGDVHGLAEQFLERFFGTGLVAPGFAGASGNIDPWYRVLPDFRTNNGWIPEPVLLGTLLGEEVALVIGDIRKSTTNGSIKTAIRTVALPGKSPSDTPDLAAGPPRSLIITVGCVGDIAFVGLGGEVFNEIGQRIKAASPFAHTFIVTHCNGASGYVPIHSSYGEGGYEVQTSPFGPGAEDRLVEETKRLLAELRQSP